MEKIEIRIGVSSIGRFLPWVGSVPPSREEIDDGAFGVPMGVIPLTVSSSIFSSSCWFITFRAMFSFSKSPAGARGEHTLERPLVGVRIRFRSRILFAWFLVIRTN
jgi:hypothetical protein